MYKLNIISYSKIEFVSIRTNDSSKFNVRLKVSGIKHKIQNPKTGEDEIEEGELTAELIILKNLDNLKLLDLYSYSIKPYSSETQSINNEVDSLSGKISFNSIDSEYTDEEVEAFVDIYKKYRNRILSFNEVNENQVTISNSTGFIYEDGIVIANWTWFENY